MQLGFFFSTTPSDWHLAPRLVGQIEAFYPEAKILCLPDGFSPGPLPGAIVGDAAEPLKQPASIHQYSYRRCTLALAHLDGCEVLVQLDPDTYLQKPFTHWPQSQWAGSFMAVPTTGPPFRKFMHGALWMMRRQLLQQLVEENPFCPQHYAHDNNTRADGTAIEDRGFSEAVRLVYPADQWAAWGQLNTSGQVRPGWAAAHPVKEL
ncbi:MAG: hypothetical protein KME14_20265 [Tildeniella torsiva UHER 1998/13D]|jgi:hypothetical protein|nr:hypothetical protein [Tildeniella torsiva UHER 1998/13D]